MTGGYDYKRYAVLYVDDEEKSLKYFRRAYEKDFRVLTATSVEAALALLEQGTESVGVLVTDQRMPGQTGVDLLGRVRRRWPGIVRILTTAYSDLESAIDAVNSGAVYRYVTKPWNLQDLRGALLRAMEFFLVQQERDLLLQEKLSVLQRIIITDRVRSLAVLAGGLAHHIRNSTTALKAFLDLASPKLLAGPGATTQAGEGFSMDLWTLARLENQHLQTIVQQVADSAVDPAPTFDDRIALPELVAPAVDEVRKQAPEVRIAIDPALPTFRVDAPMIRKLFRLLLLRLARVGGPGVGVAVRAEETLPVWGAPGARIAVTSDGPAWSEDLVASFYTLFTPEEGDPAALGLDLLAAFCVVHHHGGDLLVHRDHPRGPGFEVLLPFDPEAVQRPSLEDNCLEKLFTHFESWDAVRGGA